MKSNFGTISATLASLLLTVSASAMAPIDSKLPCKCKDELRSDVVDVHERERPQLKRHDGPMCPWIPREELRPSPQCGFNDFGLPEPGLYECGTKPQGDRCVPHCRFERCWTY